jgi:imidazole glycerol-phosphate synthase subunit HisF
VSKAIRVIARMDIKGPNLVKGIHLEGLRVLGSPEEYAKHYYKSGADELFYQDVVASLYGRNSLDDIITRTAKNLFIPLTVGGGIRSINDIKRVLNAGADKVAINTAAINDLHFIKNAVNTFGSSTIIVAIEAIRSEDGSVLAYTDNGREFTGVDVFEWALKLEQYGVGEICLTSVDQDGTGLGYDDEMIKAISSAVSIPVIAHGGADSPSGIVRTIKHAEADAVAIASIIHYDYLNRKKSKNHVVLDEGNTEFLKNYSGPGKIQSYSIESIKNELTKSNIPCRNSSSY